MTSASHVAVRGAGNEVPPGRGLEGRPKGTTKGYLASSVEGAR